MSTGVSRGGIGVFAANQTAPPLWGCTLMVKWAAFRAVWQPSQGFRRRLPDVRGRVSEPRGRVREVPELRGIAPDVRGRLAELRRRCPESDGVAPQGGPCRVPLLLSSGRIPCVSLLLRGTREATCSPGQMIRSSEKRHCSRAVAHGEASAIRTVPPAQDEIARNGRHHCKSTLRRPAGVV